MKNSDDKRQMLVPLETLDAVRAAFPMIDIELHHAQQEDEDVQMQWLSRTDILVGNIGSASFRMLFLSDGAQVRLPYSSTPVDAWSQQTHHTGPPLRRTGPA